MRSSYSLSLLFLASLLTGCGAGGGGEPTGGSGNPPPPVGSMSSSELAWAQQVLDLVNVERERVSLPPLQWHAAASQVAYGHSVDMDWRNFFSHTNPDGLSPGGRINAASIPWTAWGENIARGQDDPGAVMNAWMNSDGHRANILNSMFTHLGVGVHTAAGGPWWTQVFLRQ